MVGPTPEDLEAQCQRQSLDSQRVRLYIRVGQAGTGDGEPVSRLT